MEVVQGHNHIRLYWLQNKIWRMEDRKPLTRHEIDKLLRNCKVTLLLVLVSVICLGPPSQPSVPTPMPKGSVSKERPQASDVSVPQSNILADLKRLIEKAGKKSFYISDYFNCTMCEDNFTRKEWINMDMFIIHLMFL